MSVCDQEKHELRGSYKEAAYAVIQQHHDTLERRSHAVLTLHPDGRTVSLWGHPGNVRMARALVNELLVPLEQGAHALLVTVNSACSEEDRHIPFCHTLSPGAESHDSCYDSDGSACLSHRSSHDDISRTVSDTLAAEHGDQEDIVRKVPVYASESSPPVLAVPAESQSSSPFSKQRTKSDGNHEEDHEDVPDEDLNSSVESLSDDTDYLNKVHFTIKLGYTEDQLRAVLKRRGAHITQNELLSELITLGSLDKSTDDESPPRSPTPECSLPVTPHITSHSPVSAGPADNLRHIVIDGSNVAMR